MLNKNKIILLFVIIFFSGVSFASEEVYLDLNIPEIHKFDTGKLRYENQKKDEIDDEDYLKPSFWTMKKMFDEDFHESENVTKKK